jgi:hypothetical protein
MEGVKLGLGVGETSKGVAETEDVVMVVGVNGNQVGDEVGVKVRVVVGVAVARLFPSASESERPPRSKPIETRAMTIPRNTCLKIFIAVSLQATLPRPASGH